MASPGIDGDKNPDVITGGILTENIPPSVLGWF